MLRTNILTTMGRGLAILLLLVGIVSCNTVFDDQSACPRGVSLRFVFEHNMEYVNSFHRQGHCVNVFVFDSDGNFVDNWIENDPNLVRNEDYRMERKLEKGSYTLIAYGGLTCDDASFTYLPLYTKIPGQEAAVTMRHRGYESCESLHSLFYGSATVEIGDDDYVEKTIYMIKNTNNLRFILQQMNGEQVVADEFSVSICDDNAALGWDNEVIPYGLVTYSPWIQGETIIGVQENGQTPVSAAFYELSTSRLTLKTSPRLMVFSKARQEYIINIPLNTYLLLLKSELYSEMPSQEFLDRISEWSLVFFLDSQNRWVNTRIVVNDWVVRINSTDF